MLTDPTGLLIWDEFVTGTNKVPRTIGNWTIPGYRNMTPAVDSALEGKAGDAVQYAVAAGAEAGTSIIGGKILGKLLTKAPVAAKAFVDKLDEAAIAGNGSRSATNGIKLGQKLASEQQVGEPLAGQGKPLAGAGTDKALKAADGFAETYGGNASDWARVGSSNY